MPLSSPTPLLLSAPPPLHPALGVGEAPELLLPCSSSASTRASGSSSDSSGWLPPGCLFPPGAHHQPRSRLKEGEPACCCHCHCPWLNPAPCAAWPEGIGATLELLLPLGQPRTVGTMAAVGKREGEWERRGHAAEYKREGRMC